MQLLGDRNWYLPRWLNWLPTVRHEPAAPGAPVPATDDELTSVG